MSIIKNVLIFDLETDGLPKIFGKHWRSPNNYPDILQVSWYTATYIDNICQTDTISYGDYYVKYFGPSTTFFSKHITLQLLEKEGQSIEFITKLLTSLLDKSDIIISHNIDFDVNVLFAFLHKHNAMLTSYTTINTLCTMKYGINICKLEFRGSSKYKYPSLIELYTKCTDKIPDASKLHNSEYDTQCLVEIVSVLLEKYGLIF